MEFYLGLLITALILLVEHWFPWPRKPHLIARYVMGSGAVMLGVAVWLAPKGQWETLLGLAVFYLVSGAVTVLAYVHDHTSNLKQQLMNYERNQE